MNGAAITDSHLTRADTAVESATGLNKWAARFEDKLIKGRLVASHGLYPGFKSIERAKIGVSFAPPGSGTPNYSRATAYIAAAAVLLVALLTLTRRI